VLFQYRAREDRLPTRGPAVGLFADQEIRLLNGPLFVDQDYELEREIIRERIHAGLSRARAQGKTLGRKPVSARTEERIRELRAKGLGKLKIARELECGVSTVQRVLAAS